MADLLEQSLPFVVQVLEGLMSREPLQAGQAPGLVSLRGRALPYRPISFETVQRVRTTWYPGNPKATQQVLGAEDKPTVVSGFWKDRYVGDGNSRALQKVFERMCRLAPQIQVTWGAGAVSTDVGGGSVVGEPIVRYGVLRRTKFTHETPQRIMWELEFEWNGLEEVTAPVVAATGQADPRQGLNAIAAQVDEAAGFAEALRLVNQKLGLPLRVARDLDAALEQARAASRAIGGVSATIANLSQVPFQARASLWTSVALGLSAATALRAAVEALPRVALVPTDDPISWISFRGDQLETLGQASEAAGLAADGVDSLGQEVEPNVIAEVRAPAGTDLRDLAVRFYGDPDGWVAIANFNDLPTSRVPDAPTGPSEDGWPAIRIPELRAGAQGDLAAGC